MRADIRRKIEPGDLRVQQVCLGRLFGSVQELVAIDDLDDAVRAGAVSEVHPVDLRTERDRAVQLRRDWARRSGLLAWQPEVADEHRLGWIAQVVDLRHAARAPLGIAADDIGDAGVALPPVLVRVDEAVDDDGHAARVRRIGDVPDLVGGAPERAQQVHLALVRARQIAAVAQPHHLGAAGLALAGLARDVHEIFRPLRNRHVDDGGAVALGLRGERVGLSAAVVADVRDPAIPLLVDDRLIPGSGLQIVEADQLHVAHFGPLLRRHAHAERDADRAQSHRDHHGRQMRTSHVTVPFVRPMLARRSLSLRLFHRGNRDQCQGSSRMAPPHGFPGTPGCGRRVAVAPF